MIRKVIISIFVSLFCVININAQLSKAKEYYKKGNYESALPLFKKEYKKNNKNKKNGSINHWIGVCLYKLGKYDESIQYFEYAMSRKVIESPHYIAKIYSNKYQFDDALKMYDVYQNMLIESNKKIAKGVREEIRYAKLAKSMLDHVEDIVVLDSISVEKNKFFEYYMLSSETGNFVAQYDLPVSIEHATLGFKDQSNSRLLWAMPDENGKMKLCESVKLIDGNWDKPKFIGKKILGNENQNYPFLMQDGVTLYFASNDENSLGGYDIYFTRKDEETGEFLKSQNIGMPYNSSSNDYLLVLDDVTGLGWWATERNNIEGKVTIYVFKRNIIRKNHRIDEINLTRFAKMCDYKSTWRNNDYQSEVDKINTMRNLIEDYNLQKDFIFIIKKGLVYHSFIDFKSKDAVQEMKQLLTFYKDREQLKLRLNDLRLKWTKSSAMENFDKEILDVENELNKLNEIIFKTENWVRKEEQRLLK